MLSLNQAGRQQLPLASTAKLKAISCYRLRLEHDRDALSRHVSPRAESVAGFLWTEFFHNLAQEAFAVVFVDAEGVTGWIEPFFGTVNRVAVEPRTILAAALVHGADRLLLAHNHPSGDPTPSAEDHLFTQRIRDASETLGLRLVDSLVLAPWRERRTFRWTSLYRPGGSELQAA